MCENENAMRKEVQVVKQCLGWKVSRDGICCPYCMMVRWAGPSVTDQARQQRLVGGDYGVEQTVGATRSFITGVCSGSNSN